MTTPQANIGPIPNTFLGMIAFGGLGAIAVVILAGATFKRWLWIVLHLASAVGVGFMVYLFFQSVFRIHAICPWCFFVWIVTFPVFLGITVYTIREHIYRVPRNIIGALGMYTIQRHPGKILAIWYIALLGILLQHFWYYWSTLL